MDPDQQTFSTADLMSTTLPTSAGHHGAHQVTQVTTPPLIVSPPEYSNSHRVDLGVTNSSQITAMGMSIHGVLYLPCIVRYGWCSIRALGAGAMEPAG